MTSVIVVDNELKDSVKEYGQIVDTLNQNDEFSQSLKPFFNEQTEEITNKEELSKAILASSQPSTLGKLADKEFEPTFNLIVYLLTQLDSSKSYEAVLTKDSQLIKNLIDSTPTEKPSLRDRKALRYVTILSALNTIFNLLPETSSTRIYIIDSILNIVDKSNIGFELIENSMGDHLVNWLSKANASETELKAIFWKFINLDKNHSIKALKIIKKFTSTYSLNLEELHHLIQMGLLCETPDVSFLINNSVAKALKQNESDELSQIFVKYTKGELITSIPSSITIFTQEQIERILFKSKTLALTRFFIENDENKKNVFKYNEIPSSLSSSQLDFEELLITAIKYGLIEGKLSQIDETFHLTKVSRFIIAGDEHELAKNWEFVRQSLVNWRIALDNLDEVVDNAREEIVRNNDQQYEEEYHGNEEDDEEPLVEQQQQQQQQQADQVHE